jgi:hypothetical protein
MIVLVRRSPLCLDRSVSCVYYLLEILDFGLQKLDEIRIAILKLAIDCVQSKIQNLKSKRGYSKSLETAETIQCYSLQVSMREKRTKMHFISSLHLPARVQGRCPLGALVLNVTGT